MPNVDVMKLSLGITTSMSIKESTALAGAAEHEGYSRIWVGDDLFCREVFTYLSVLSLKTTGVGLGSGITPVYGRNKIVISNSAKAVSELSGGMFTLGIGVGGLPEIEKLTGERPKNVLSTMEQAIDFLRETGLKIYVGARGPRMLELSGRLADGVIMSGPKRYIGRAVELIDRAAGDRSVRKVLWNAFYLGEDQMLLSNITGVMLESMPGFAKQFMDPSDPQGGLCISGDRDTILDEIRGYMALGIDEFVVGPPYGKNPVRVVEEVAELWRSL